jgi:hypothetical protein
LFTARPIATAPSVETSSVPAREAHSAQIARLARASVTSRASSWACRKIRDSPPDCPSPGAPLSHTRTVAPSSVNA